MPEPICLLCAIGRCDHQPGDCMNGTYNRDDLPDVCHCEGSR